MEGTFIMKKLSWIAYALLVIGGLVHLGQAFNYYAVDELLPGLFGTIVYLLVGLAGVYGIFGWLGLRK